MHVCTQEKKSNRSISVASIDKSNSVYKEIKNFGVVSSDDEANV